MKKVIFIILGLSTLACNSENYDDSVPVSSSYTSRNSELETVSKDSRPQKWAKKVTGSPFDNLYKVNDDIYRSEQPDSDGYNYLQQKNVASILNLRSGHTDNVGGTNYTGNLYNVPMVASSVSDVEIIKALRIIRTAPKPIDIHCQHGSDRTGVTLAMYRIVFQNWSKQDATQEMKEGGYNFHPQYTNLVNYIANVDVDYIKTKVFN
ncbi:phosphatase domain-containing putative toxin [Chryseobacterium vrystaatense]|uniref:Tyrosine phosphatase family protein n=1 Tax=Chryseobacterium vrystaatense TaxID=307480 RepID=A0A1M5IN88_9FLAO|nr:protein tyrosine phosphatase [Chryseobacterium vrystaatense]SHG29253.1 Tyrosine phosphatase family protein [Chryseobacterium vrystaatense]